MNRLLTSSLTGFLLLAAFTAGPAAAAPPAAAEKAASPEQAVRAIAEKIRDDLKAAAPWKPNAAQIAAIAATPEDAARLTAYVDEIYGQLSKAGPAAKPGQTEILVSGPALADLPGGYKQQAAHFNPAIRFYSFKYVVPGEKLGMSYNGLCEVDGKWVLIPKAWRAFKP